MSAEHFTVEVEGIGKFTFKRRRLREGFAVMAEIARLTGGEIVGENEVLRYTSHAYASLKVQTVEAPEGWSLDDLDPEDDDSYANILKVWTALRKREDEIKVGEKKKGA